MIKTALFDLVSMKNVAVQWRTGHLPSFLVPTLGDLTAQEYPPPGIRCHVEQSENDQLYFECNWKNILSYL